MYSDAVVKFEAGSRGYWVVLVWLESAGEGWFVGKEDWPAGSFVSGQL